MNVSAVLPWELNPVLKQERLVVLARVVVETRNKVFAEANRDEGDTNWGLGCRAHERLGHALERLVRDARHPWLTVNREGLYLMPLIDGVAVRPYRGPADRPSARHLDAVRFEHGRRQPKQVMFSFMEPVETDGPWFWLMAMETDAEGKVLRVVFFQANESGETRHPWDCPLDGLTTRLPRPAESSERLSPREIPPPVVELAAFVELAAAPEAELQAG
jgi:hypothetical protein